jgi:hypothetical protein
MGLVIPAFWSRRDLKTGDYDDDNPYYDYPPECIYFYHVTRDESKQRIEAYRLEAGKQIPADELDGYVIDLVKNARGANNAPSPIGLGLKAMKWRRISWIVIALDDGRVFPHGKAVRIRHLRSGFGHPNHCFFGGGDKPLDIPGCDPVSMMWTLNTMRDRKGNLLNKDVEETFEFKFPFVDPLLATFLTLFSYDDENPINMGPPIGPPPR